MNHKIKIPVSYTHLDVYKRQPAMWSYDLSAERQTQTVLPIAGELLSFETPILIHTVFRST